MIRLNIAPLDDGSFDFTVPQVLRQMVIDLAVQLDEDLESDNSALQRLFPTAYSNDPEKDAGYQVLARDELVQARHDSLATVIRTAELEIVDVETLDSWMRVVNDLRLVLGTSLDVSESEDWEPEAGQEGMYGAYHWLGILLTHIVEAQF